MLNCSIFIIATKRQKTAENGRKRQKNDLVQKRQYFQGANVKLKVRQKEHIFGIYLGVVVGADGARGGPARASPYHFVADRGLPRCRN
jgi:hypothetical protein